MVIRSSTFSNADIVAIKLNVCNHPSTTGFKFRKFKLTVPPRSHSHLTVRVRRWGAERLPRIVIGNSTFSNADMVAIRLNVCNVPSSGDKADVVCSARAQARSRDQAVSHSKIPHESDHISEVIALM
jgi:hypothetical protein